MSGNDEERAKLDFGTDLDLEEKPALDPATIRQVSERAGFRNTEAPANSPARKQKTTSKAQRPVTTEPLPKRRTRRRTGRIHQFATRLDEATYRAIYETADREDITLAEVIEQAMTALINQPPENR